MYSLEAWDCKIIVDGYYYMYMGIWLKMGYLVYNEVIIDIICLIKIIK
jgi:hypothetical protein